MQNVPKDAKLKNKLYNKTYYNELYEMFCLLFKQLFAYTITIINICIKSCQAANPKMNSLHYLTT